MPINRCRVCDNPFFKKPLLQYKNMPKAAQYLPDINGLENDQGVSLDIYQCAACGLVQLDNEPVPYYKEVVRAAAFSSEMKQFRLDQFKRIIEKYTLNNKKVIEIGCGKGEYLSLIQAVGVKAYGLEYSEDSVTECLNQRLNVLQGYIDDSSYNIEHGHFDAFFILSFLEHFPDPNSMLQGIHHNLVDGGIGVVEVPNFDMIIKHNLFSEFIGDHLLYFTQETLKTMLNLNGFEVIECHEIWHDYIISAVVKKRQMLDISRFSYYQENLKQLFETFLSQYRGKKVAVWGAGHQALAILALLDLADKIRYVVDSATFKQNRYTPATHIPIVSPDKLSSDPVDAVIVMAASYSDEVAKILRERFGSSMKIVVLRDSGLES